MSFEKKLRTSTLLKVITEFWDIPELNFKSSNFFSQLLAKILWALRNNDFWCFNQSLKWIYDSEGLFRREMACFGLYFFNFKLFRRFWMSVLCTVAPIMWLSRLCVTSKTSCWVWILRIHLETSNSKNCKTI